MTSAIRLMMDSSSPPSSSVGDPQVAGCVSAYAMKRRNGSGSVYRLVTKCEPVMMNVTCVLWGRSVSSLVTMVAVMYTPPFSS